MIARSTLLAFSWGAFLVAPFSSSNLPPQLLPVYGGVGGTSFNRSCGAGRVLTGLRFRDGLLVDAVGILCRPVLTDGTLGPESTAGTIVGGGSNTARTRSCGSGQVVVGALIKHGTYVNQILLHCRTWDPISRKFGGAQRTSSMIGHALSGGTENTERCESLSQPANGIRGRAHSVVDAIGFICDEP